MRFILPFLAPWILATAMAAFLVCATHLNNTPLTLGNLLNNLPPEALQQIPAELTLPELHALFSTRKLAYNVIPATDASRPARTSFVSAVLVNTLKEHVPTQDELYMLMTLIKSYFPEMFARAKKGEKSDLSELITIDGISHESPAFANLIEFLNKLYHDQKIVGRFSTKGTGQFDAVLFSINVAHDLVFPLAVNAKAMGGLHRFINSLAGDARWLPGHPKVDPDLPGKVILPEGTANIQGEILQQIHFVSLNKWLWKYGCLSHQVLTSDEGKRLVNQFSPRPLLEKKRTVRPPPQPIGEPEMTFYEYVDMCAKAGEDKKAAKLSKQQSEAVQQHED